MGYISDTNNKKRFTLTPKFGVTLRSKGGFTPTPYCGILRVCKFLFGVLSCKIKRIRNIKDIGGAENLQCRNWCRGFTPLEVFNKIRQAINSSRRRIRFYSFLKSRRSAELLTGFTLLETLVALSILTSAVVGPLTLAFYSMRSASLSQNQLTAFYLAQEAIEYVKNRRDINVLTGAANWLDGFAPSGGGNGLCRNNKGCTIDIPYNSINQCPGSGDCPKMRYSGDTGFYHQNTSFGIESPFTRKVKLDFVSSYEEKVSVTISWSERFGIRFFTLEENIFNWP